MGKRGPQAKPTELKLLQGNPGKRPLSKNEPKPTAGYPSSPTKLLTGEARKEWGRIKKAYAHTGVVTKVDRGALILLCLAWDDYWAARDSVAATGHVFETDTGYMGKNPMVSVMNEAADRYVKLCREFGLTPASRVGLTAPGEKKEQTELEKWMSERRVSA